MPPRDRVRIVAGTCARCRRPIVALDPHGGPEPPRWVAPPVGAPDAHQCDGEPHLARSDGLILAGVLDPDQIQAEALTVSELAVALVEADHHRRRRVRHRRAA